MPTLKVPESFGIDSNQSFGEVSLLESSKINAYNNSREQQKNINGAKKSAKSSAITPKTEFAMRQANHLVERICREHGVEAPNISFANCLQGQEDEIAHWSDGKHDSVLRLAEYMHKRGQIERDYSLSIQKLNRNIMQSEDTDERLGQLIVMGEKTATSHMDFARKIEEERIVEDLKILCVENEEQRRNLLVEIRKLRGIWTKAVGAFEKVRKNRDKALKAVDSAQLALENALSRGNANKNTLFKLKEEVNQKLERARVAREEYNQAMNGLTKRQSEIFKERIPKCFEGFEKMERSRIAAVRASLINLAQVNLAIANVEIESSQRWLKSLVSISIDDEIENFVRSVEEENGHVVQEINFEDEAAVEENETTTSAKIHENESLELSQKNNNKLYIDSNLTNSETDLLTAAVDCGLEEKVDPKTLKERKEKIERVQVKLRQQLEALERMEQAYTEQEESNNLATLEAIRSSKRVISREIEENANLFVQIEMRLACLPPSNNNFLNDHVNPMTSILEELNKLDQRRGESQFKKESSLEEFNLQKKQKQVSIGPPKKSLSRSFEEILNDNGDEGLVREAVASPKATGLKLPGAQWTAAAIIRSNEEINSDMKLKNKDDDFYCAEEEEEEEERLLIERRNFRNRLGSAGSEESKRSSRKQSTQFTARKSIGQSTPNVSASRKTSPKSIDDSTFQSYSKSLNNKSENNCVMIPQNNQELFKVRALYNFIGRKETDELDLRVDEILGIFEASGEWWEAENEVGVRGYVPFNYVIKI